MPNNIGSFQWNQMPSKAFYNNGYFGWIQFSEIPNQSIQNQFKENGLELIDYIPKNAYLFYFPASTDINYLKTVGVKSIIPVANNLKMSLRIKNDDIGDWAIDGDNILINLQYYKKVPSEFIVSKLSEALSIEIIEEYKNSNIITVSISRTDIDVLADFAFIKWIELATEPSVPEDIRGKSIHRSASLDTQTATGRKYTGVGVGVMVRDDGIVGPHIDFQGRIDNSSASGTGATHGDGVAGILTGAGNLDPTKRGMAAGSDVYVVNYASSFLDAATTNLTDGGDVQITNSSYGNGCNDGYTTTAQTVDSQTNTNLSLLHVFSAGNSGTLDCNPNSYGAGAGWGNITGGHKQGKNVIATANVFFDGSMPSHSSNGPAYDGRIKPDITAHGQDQLSTDENNGYLTFGGTSGAAPGIAGVSAQLYQAYMDLNAGAMPESALIKASMLNTAQDYGNVGPDFKFGWGIVNGLRAAMLLEDGRYLDDNISQGDINNHTISVPANTKQVRFMVYWNDPASTAGVATALVNDLDLVVTDPSSTDLLPWILDPTPDPALLDLPATNGVDHLNNMEQVLINNPQSGNYNIEITGFGVPSGPQHYYVVYEIITDELVLTYPQGKEKMVVGSQEVIHWDAINTANNIVIDYSTDNGNSWTQIADLASTITNYTWTVPNTISGECLVRVTSGSSTSTSDETFSIANLVTGVDVSQICPNDITVVWNSLADATSYDVYLLGNRYMEKVGTSATNSLSIPITDPNVDFWVAVTATGGNNWESRRTIAINKSGGLLNCSLNADVTVESLNNDLSNLSLICDGNSILVSANIRNLGIDDQTNFLVSYQLDTDAVVQETYSGTLISGAQESYEFTTPLVFTTDGNHDLKVWVTLTGDEFVGNDEISTNFYAQIDAVTLNLLEPFDVNGVPPSGWEISNPDNSTTWVKADNIIGVDGQPTSTAFVDNATYNAAGQLDILKTVVYDLTGTDVVLNFDLAKAQWSSNFNDGLLVEISTDCGTTYTTIYDKDGLTLSTIPNYVGSSWSPASAADWRTETIDLSAYANTQSVIRFVNVAGYSNGTYIDNINVAGTPLSVGNERLNNELSLFPNPTNGNFTVRLKSMYLNTVKIFDIYGKEIKSLNIKNNKRSANINIDNLSTGVYFISVESENSTAHRKIIKK
ncbi:MAG: peptidase S8 [Lutibacter sp.]|nr:MAG: peptidase S8 [Lutibacter sp.]